MNIYTLDIPQNLTKKEFRDLSRHIVEHRTFNQEQIIKIFNDNHVTDSAALLEFFLSHGLFDKKLGEKYQDYWQPSIALIGISNASLTKRKTLDKAWKEVAHMVARTVAIQKYSETWTSDLPSHVYLFGSMLNPKKADFGDADLILSVQHKPGAECLEAKQQAWLKKHEHNMSPGAIGKFGFSDYIQQIIDVRHSRSFLSFHTEHDPEHMCQSLDCYKVSAFPIISLWSDWASSRHPDAIDELDNLCTKWKDNNQKTFQNIQSLFNQALADIGIPATNEPGFKDACYQFVIKDIAQELFKKSHELNFNEIHDGHNPIFNQLIRLGEFGFEAYGRYLRMTNQNLSQNILENSSYFQELLDSEKEKFDGLVVKGWLKEDAEQKQTISKKFSFS